MKIVGGILFLYLMLAPLIHWVLLIPLAIFYFGKKKDRLKENKSIIILEMIYGIINPFLYIIMCEFNVLFPEVFLLPLKITAVIVIIVYWYLRLFISHNFKIGKISVKYIMMVVDIAALIVLSLFSIKDKLGYIIYGSMYIIPYFILIKQIMLLYNDQLDTFDKYIFIRNKKTVFDFISIGFLIILVTVSAVAFALSSKKIYNDKEIQKIIIENREIINNSANKYNVDPSVIASIIYYNLDHQTYLKNALTDTTLKYYQGNTIIIPFMDDLNIGNHGQGFCRIKPRTLKTAIHIYVANSKKYTEWRVIYPKRYRDVRVLNDNWRIKSKLIALYEYYPDNPEKMSIEMKNEKNNIEACAYILSLYNIQWNEKGFPIDKKPEILYSLYQLGFQNSLPKENPIAIKSSREFIKIYNGEFIKSLFEKERKVIR